MGPKVTSMWEGAEVLRARCNTEGMELKEKANDDRKSQRKT